MNQFSYLKERLSILDVVGEYTTLKKAGTYWKGHCPFHSEKTASFTVSPHKEIFYCFGCHIGGDAISFIAKVEHCSASEAVQHLAERYNITLPTEFHQELPKQDKKHYYEICEFLALWCHEQLKRSPAGLHYLLKRGFTKDSMQHFSLGYLPGGYQRIRELITAAQKQNILVKDLVEFGFLQEGKTVLYSSFEERIIFPIKDHLGRFCGFGGRIFKPDDERPKYYNSRENPFFSKGALLFGFDKAKKSMQQTELAFLVEGYVDCIAMAQHGFSNTVATLGTACTTEHLKLLSRYIKKLFVVYDGDKAGREAIIRLTSLCWQANLELSVVQLPEHEDPASLLTKEKDLVPYLHEAQDIFVFFIKNISEGFSEKSMAEKIAITKKLLATINTVTDNIAQDLLLQKASKVLNIPFETLKHEFEKLKSTKRGGTLAKEHGPASLPQETSTLKINSSPIGEHKLEKALFSAIINNIELIKEQNIQLLLEHLPSPWHDILIKLRNLKQETPSLSFIDFFDTLDSCEREFLSKCLLEYEGEFEPTMVEALILQLQRNHWKTIVNSFKKQLDIAKERGDHVKEQQLLHDFLALKKKLLTINLP